MREQRPSEDDCRQNPTHFVEITSVNVTSACSCQLYATQLNVISQLFRTAGKSSRKTHSFDTNSSHTSYGTTKRSHLWTTLTSSVCQHRCRCSRPTSSPWSNHWRDAYDLAPLSRRRVYRVRTAIASYATLLVILSLLIKLFLLLITAYPDLTFRYRPLSC